MTTCNISKKWLIALMPLSLSLSAQNIAEGESYYLPKTAVNFTIQVEKTSYTPGDLHMYAERYLKKSDVGTEPSTTYRILSIKMSTVGIPDTAKHFYAHVDSKHSISKLTVDESGILLAVNAEGKPQQQPEPFVPAKKPQRPNPRDFMNQDILSTGSTAKMAELTAQEIYDIRDSKNQLNKGQADFMPKDGEQLRIMLNNLNTQEAALLQMFEGITDKDTLEHVITYIPEKDTNSDILFRFSTKLGIVDNDDLAGTPFHINIEDLHKTVSNTAVVEGAKKGKDDANIYANLPGKIKMTLRQAEKTMATYEVYAAQFGRTEMMDNELFGKKLITSLVYNPVTGNVESIKTEMVKK